MINLRNKSVIRFLGTSNEFVIQQEKKEEKKKKKKKKKNSQRN